MNNLANFLHTHKILYHYFIAIKKIVVHLHFFLLIDIEKIFNNNY